MTPVKPHLILPLSGYCLQVALCNEFVLYVLSGCYHGEFNLQLVYS